jgi:hypothetical protein
MRFNWLEMSVHNRGDGDGDGDEDVVRSFLLLAADMVVVVEVAAQRNYNMNSMKSSVKSNPIQSNLIYSQCTP